MSADADNPPPVARATMLLQAVREGNSQAADELFECVYDELHAIAERIFRSQAKGHTLQPTALLHEAYVKLLGSAAGPGQAQDRHHLMNLAARAMRQVLVNHARDKGAAKRGGGADRQRVTLSAVQTPGSEPVDLDVLALHEALQDLAKLDERQAQVVELRTFGGLTNPEVADSLDVSLRTVELDWRMAKVWLADRLKGR